MSLAGSLLAWFHANARDLPWRRARTPYRVVVSELMLQQTTVAAAIPHFERFVARFPSWRALAAATPDEVLAAWAGLGYYRRARSLHAMARAIVAAGAEFPRSLEAALDLPGVGPYTAGAVLSLAHGVPAPAVDGNVARVLARLCGRPWQATSARDRREMERVVMELQPRDAPGAFNEALIELGATTCTPRRPSCDACPLARECVALRDGLVGVLPPLRPRGATREVAAAAAIVERAGRVLLRRIPPDAELLAGLWELPGGFTGGEPASEWLAREVLAPFGGGSVLAEAGRVKHAITTRRITVSLWRCALDRAPRASSSIAWVAPSEAEALGITAATRKALRAVGPWPG
jgi:A/G-specific adenine glycosylase